MSNTAEVVSYDPVVDLASVADAAATILEVGGAVVAVGAVALAATVRASVRAAQAVMTESVVERTNRETIESRDNAALLSAEQARRPCEIRLPQGDPEALVSAARSLGYQELTKQQGATASRAFVHSNGELLVVKRTSDRVNLTTNSGRAAIDRVMQESQLLRARAFLEKFSGHKVQERRVAGRIELKAQEVSERKVDGRATIEMSVDRDGTLRPDISGIRGNRCEKVLEDLTKSVGGKVLKKKIKPDYHKVAVASTNTVKVGR